MTQKDRFATSYDYDLKRRVIIKLPYKKAVKVYLSEDILFALKNRGRRRISSYIDELLRKDLGLKFEIVEVKEDES